MKKNRFFITSAAAALLSALPALQSCIDDGDDGGIYRPTALVTVCPAGDGSFTMRLDDNTTLYPSNMSKSPYGQKEVRALVNYTDEMRDGVGRSVHVNRMDSIRTKLPEAYLAEGNDEKYGTDAVEIVKDWVTVAEDGYLTMRIRALWSNANVPHRLNLLTGMNPDNPFELELRHDANGDTGTHWGDALIAFNLNKLPRVSGDKVRIKLHWKSAGGCKSAEFNLALRPAGGDMAQGLTSALRVE